MSESGGALQTCTAEDVSLGVVNLSCDESNSAMSKLTVVHDNALPPPQVINFDKKRVRPAGESADSADDLKKIRIDKATSLFPGPDQVTATALPLISLAASSCSAP